MLKVQIYINQLFWFVCDDSFIQNKMFYFQIIENIIQMQDIYNILQIEEISRQSNSKALFQRLQAKNINNKNIIKKFFKNITKNTIKKIQKENQISNKPNFNKIVSEQQKKTPFNSTNVKLTNEVMNEHLRTLPHTNKIQSMHYQQIQKRSEVKEGRHRDKVSLSLKNMIMLSLTMNDNQYNGVHLSNDNEKNVKNQMRKLKIKRRNKLNSEPKFGILELQKLINNDKKIITILSYPILPKLKNFI